ncbi:MAG: hypothetical protein GY801_05110 [bacterium]|nr:hypothetical protein [bacterium]
MPDVILLDLKFFLMADFPCCWVDSADFDPQRDYGTLAAPDSIMGSPIAQLLWPFAENWPVTLLPAEYRQVQPSAVDTLIINGNLDFSTPVEHVINELLPALENGRKIILTDMGHDDDFWNAQPEAAAHLLRSYFDTGDVDESLFTHQAVNFEVGFPGFPALGKFMFFLPLFMIVSVGLLIGLVVWRVRVRRKKRTSGHALSKHQ